MMCSKKLLTLLSCAVVLTLAHGMVAMEPEGEIEEQELSPLANRIMISPKNPLAKQGYLTCGTIGSVYYKQSKNGCLYPMTPKDLASVNIALKSSQKFNQAVYAHPYATTGIVVGTGGLISAALIKKYNDNELDWKKCTVGTLGAMAAGAGLVGFFKWLRPPDSTKYVEEQNFVVNDASPSSSSAPGLLSVLSLSDRSSSSSSASASVAPKCIFGEKENEARDALKKYSADMLDDDKVAVVLPNSIEDLIDSLRNNSLINDTKYSDLMFKLNAIYDLNFVNLENAQRKLNAFTDACGMKRIEIATQPISGSSSSSSAASSSDAASSSSSSSSSSSAPASVVQKCIFGDEEAAVRDELLNAFKRIDDTNIFDLRNSYLENGIRPKILALKEKGTISVALHDEILEKLYSVIFGVSNIDDQQEKLNAFTDACHMKRIILPKYCVFREQVSAMPVPISTTVVPQSERAWHYVSILPPLSEQIVVQVLNDADLRQSVQASIDAEMENYKNQRQNNAENVSTVEISAQETEEMKQSLIASRIPVASDKNQDLIKGLVERREQLKQSLVESLLWKSLLGAAQSDAVASVPVISSSSSSSAAQQQEVAQKELSELHKKIVATIAKQIKAQSGSTHGNLLDQVRKGKPLAHVDVAQLKMKQNALCDELFQTEKWIDQLKEKEEECEKEENPWTKSELK